MRIERSNIYISLNNINLLLGSIQEKTDCSIHALNNLLTPSVFCSIYGLSATLNTNCHSSRVNEHAAEALTDLDLA